MREIDKNILDIFDKNDEEIYKEHSVELDDREVSFVLGDFVRYFENYSILNQIQTQQYPAQYSKVKHKVKHKYFIKLVNNLKRIDLNKTPSIEKQAKQHNYRKVLHMLDTLRIYFEEREGYEYCAIVKSYIDACYLPPIGQPPHTLEAGMDIQALFDSI